MKILLTFFIFVLINFVHSQEAIPDDSEVLEFIVQVHRVRDGSATAVGFICVGTLLTLTHILTPRLVYGPYNVTHASQLNLRFQGNTIDQGYQASPAAMTSHNTADLTILRIGQRVDQQMRFSPRRRSQMPEDRLCTIYGYHLNSLRLVAASALTRSTQFCSTGHCAVGSVHENFQACGGLIGAPLTCDGETISAIVTEDHMCNLTITRVNLFRLQDQLQWINDNTNGAKYPIVSTSLVLFGIILFNLM